MSVKFYISFKKKDETKDSAVSLRKEDLFLIGNNKCAVILIHGLTGTPCEMLNLARFLYKKGYSVVCPTLANHGRPVEILKQTKWQECYESVRKAFLELESRVKPEIIYAAGLSVGALFALHLAADFKGRISGVSCLAPTLFYDGWNMPWTKFLLPLAYFTPLKYFFYFKEEPPYGIKNEAVRRHVHNYYKNARIGDAENAIQYGYPYIPVSLLYQHYLFVRHFKKRLPHIDVPVQLIQAEDDDMASVRNSQFIYNTINSKIKDMVLLKDSYHVITADQERDKVAREMERFFIDLKERL